MTNSPISVLLFEDNPIHARLLQGFLKPEFAVEAVDNLAAGLARLEAGGIDAILLDLVLPDSQELATFERVKATVPNIPVLVLTGLDDEVLAEEAVAAGALRLPNQNADQWRELGPVYPGGRSRLAMGGDPRFLRCDLLAGAIGSFRDRACGHAGAVGLAHQRRIPQKLHARQLGGNAPTCGDAVYSWPVRRFCCCRPRR